MIKFRNYFHRNNIRISLIMLQMITRIWQLLIFYIRINIQLRKTSYEKSVTETIIHYWLQDSWITHNMEYLLHPIFIIVRVFALWFVEFFWWIFSSSYCFGIQRCYSSSRDQLSCHTFALPALKHSDLEW